MSFINKTWQRYKELQTEHPEDFAQNDLIYIVDDSEKVERFCQESWKKNKELCDGTEKEAEEPKIGIVYESPYHMMVVDVVESPKGSPMHTYERIMPTIRHGAIVTMPYYLNDEGERIYLLLLQFRHALRDFQYAFPRGFGEEGISSEENAAKEISEELDASVECCQYLGKVIPDSGLSSTSADVYLVQISRPKLKTRYEGIQNMIELTDKELRNYIAAGKITDGFTLSAVALYVCSAEKTSTSQ